MEDQKTVVWLDNEIILSKRQEDVQVKGHTVGHLTHYVGEYRTDCYSLFIKHNYKHCQTLVDTWEVRFVKFNQQNILATDKSYELCLRIINRRLKVEADYNKFLRSYE